MKEIEGKGPEKCFCLCAKVGHGSEVLPWTQKAGLSLRLVCHSQVQWLWLNPSHRASWMLKGMKTFALKWVGWCMPITPGPEQQR